MLPSTVSAADDRGSKVEKKETNRERERGRESILSGLIVKKKKERETV